MKIAIDLDEVIVEFMRSYLKFHNNEKNTHYKYEDVFDYQFEKFSGLKKSEIKELILKFSKTPEFKSLEFVQGAKESLNQLMKNENNEIFFITSRNSNTKKVTFDFFEKNFPNNHFKIIFSGENWGNLKSKGEICADWGIKLIIEDNKEYALDCAKHGIKVFLIDKPWNKDYEAHENIIKFKGWKEIMPELNKLLINK